MSTPTAPAAPPAPIGSAPGTRTWHLVAGLVSLGSLLVQFVLIVKGVNVLVDDATGLPSANAATRVLRFFSYFTVQANVIIIVTELMLAMNPRRTGRWFDVARIAGLVGITVTFVVYLVALRPILDLSGLAAVTDAGFHIVAPVMAVVGWVAFGPRAVFAWRTLWTSLAWPAAYFVYSLIHGALTGWYPYPFVDVTQIGYPAAMRNLAVVIVLLVAVGATFVWLDRRLPRSAPGPRA